VRAEPVSLLKAAPEAASDTAETKLKPRRKRSAQPHNRPDGHGLRGHLAARKGQRYVANVGDTVRLTAVPDEGQAEMLCGLLRTEGIRCFHRVADISAWAIRGPRQFWGWRDILVNEEDLARARELLAATDFEQDTE
jgi:hypothetical protein